MCQPNLTSVCTNTINYIWMAYGIYVTWLVFKKGVQWKQFCFLLYRPNHVVSCVDINLIKKICRLFKKKSKWSNQQTMCEFIWKIHKTNKITIICRKFGNKRNWETSCYRNKLRQNHQPYELQKTKQEMNIKSKGEKGRKPALNKSKI